MKSPGNLAVMGSKWAEEVAENRMGAQEVPVDFVVGMQVAQVQ